jgi:serine phosphatase RsbU (regulator of sigma subunit)
MKLFGSSTPARELRTPAPPSLPAVPNVSLAARYRGSRIGGDYYEFLHLADGRMLLVLLDIAGKRDEALHIAAALQELIHTRSVELFADRMGNANEALSQLAHEMNRGVLAAAEGVRCAPAFIALFDEPLGLMQYINAGHVPALLKDAENVQLLEAVGLPLGLFSHATHDAQVSVMQPGASLLLVSKGLIETRSGSVEFGIERAGEVLGARMWSNAEELCREVLSEAQKFSEKSPWGPSFSIPGFRSSQEPNDNTAVAMVRMSHKAAHAA